MVAQRPRSKTGSRSSRAAPPENRPLWVALAWIEAHCVVPDGFKRGAPFSLYGWQGDFLREHYTIRHDAEWEPTRPVLGPAFVRRRSGMVGVQKLGKDPMEAAQIALEGDGPALFAGWAGPDEGWGCREMGCGCGWSYAYEPGEPKGMRWPTALIQVTAVSEDATANTYQALRPMIELGPLSDRIRKTSEDFIRLPGGGRIDVVTASATSRLGQRVTFVSQGEAGLYTKANRMIAVADTQYRGLAGMGGRAVWHTNAWDPSEGSLAQREYEHPSPDVYIQFERPPSGLSMRVKDERWRIYRAVYPADVLRENDGHVDLDSIDAEAVGILAHDPAQAARFFGNQLVTGSGRAFDHDAWAARKATPDCAHPAVVIGGDGSKSDDTTALIAACCACGHFWPLGVWDPRTLPGGRVIPAEVTDAITQAFARHRVVRLWFDPPYWGDELAEWEAKWGDKVVKGWATGRNAEMGWACRRFATAIADGTLTHDGDPTLTAHIGNAHKRTLLVRDDTGEALWAIQKETRDSGLKIDAATAAVVANEARLDAIAAGVLNEGGSRDYSGVDLSIYDLSAPLPSEALT